MLHFSRPPISPVIVKATNGPRYVVGCRRQLDKTKLKSGTRVALDMTTLTIMRYLPREVDPMVYNMSHEDPGNVTYSSVGGLGEQIRELREVGTCAGASCSAVWWLFQVDDECKIGYDAMLRGKLQMLTVVFYSHPF